MKNQFTKALCPNRTFFLLLLSACFGFISTSSIAADDLKSSKVNTIKSKSFSMNEKDFFNQVYEDKVIFENLSKGGVVSQSEGEYNLVRLYKREVKDKKPIHRAVLCVDEVFDPIDLIMVYSFKKVKDEHGIEYNYILSGYSHFYEDNFSIVREKCAAFVDMVYSKVFKFPLLLGRLNMNFNGEPIESFVLKNQKKEARDLLRFRFEAKNYIIRSHVDQAVTDGSIGSWDYHDASISLVADGKKEKTIFSYHQYYLEKGKKKRSTFSFTDISKIGDFNSDGRLYILIEENFDGKSPVNVILIQTDDGFEKVGWISNGGC